jgi:hypothetical protein
LKKCSGRSRHKARFTADIADTDIEHGYHPFYFKVITTLPARYLAERFALTIDQGLLGFNFRESLRQGYNTMTIPLARRLDFRKVSVSSIAGALINDLVAQPRTFFVLLQASRQTRRLNQRMRDYLLPYNRSCEGEDRADSLPQEGFRIGHDTVVDPRPPADNGNAFFEPFAYGRYQVAPWRQTFPIARIP